VEFKLDVFWGDRIQLGVNRGWHDGDEGNPWRAELSHSSGGHAGSDFDNGNRFPVVVGLDSDTVRARNFAQAMLFAVCLGEMALQVIAEIEK